MNYHILLSNLKTKSRIFSEIKLIDCSLKYPKIYIINCLLLRSLGHFSRANKTTNDDVYVCKLKFHFPGFRNADSLKMKLNFENLYLNYLDYFDEQEGALRINCSTHR